MEELNKFIHKNNHKQPAHPASYNVTPRGSVNLRNKSIMYTQKQNNRSQRNSTMVRRNSKFFQSYLRQQSRRFSKQVLSNSFMCKKQTYMKLFILQLQNIYQNRDQQTIQATARIIAQENIFPQFGNDFKIIRIIAKYITIQTYKFGQILYNEDTINGFLHKILDGCISVKVKRSQQNEEHLKTKKNQKCKEKLKNNRRSSEENQFYELIIKEKGEVLEDMQEFKQLRDNQATCISQSAIVIKIQYQHYFKALNFYIHSKAILKMIKNSPLFLKYTTKQTEKLLQRANKISLMKNQILFNQGSHVSQEENKKMYFIIQGELNVMKKISGKYEILCTVNDGYIVGDQALFLSDQKVREYTVSVKSLYVDLLEISLKVYMDWLKINGTTIEKNIQGKNAVIEKLKHYNKILEAMEITKFSIFKYTPVQSLEQHKKQKLKKMTNIVGPIQQKVANLQKIKRKRLNFHNSEIQVSFQKPLFTRKDFPALCNSLKRFASQQKKALQYINKIKATELR